MAASASPGERPQEEPTGQHLDLELPDSGVVRNRFPLFPLPCLWYFVTVATASWPFWGPTLCGSASSGGRAGLWGRTRLGICGSLICHRALGKLLN